MNIIQDFIPPGRKNRPGKTNPMKYVTIHNTGNTAKSANAKSHALYIKSDAAANAPVSWHYTVDETCVYQHLPDNETGYHAGDGSGAGNKQSIGIEICMNSDGDLLGATDLAVQLVAILCEKHNIPIENIKQHNNWSGKNCPEMLRNGKPYSWSAFIEKVSKKLKSTPEVQPELQKDYPISSENIKAMVELGIINSPDYWIGKTSIQSLNKLMSNIASSCGFDARISNGISDIETALKVLFDAKVIENPDYWLNLIYKNADEYLGVLIVNMANKSRDILERIVWAEARGEGLEGMELVANVILNRSKSTHFPYGIYNVVFQPGQFSPITDGAYRKAVPDTNEKQAITNVLDGKDESKGATYFCTKASAAKNNWHERALQFMFEYGNHRFYKGS
jgi:N-acetylmuramoyl-L-alanine amidase